MTTSTPRRRASKSMVRRSSGLLAPSWASTLIAPDGLEGIRFPGTDKKGNKHLPATGRAGYVEAPPVMQGTSNQIAGLFPFMTSTSKSPLGAPMGTHFFHLSPVFLDFMTLFLAGGASSPSLILFGLQGRGKSSFFLRMLMGMLAAGYLVVIPGDLKGEYSKFMRHIGGKVFEVGGDKGCVNPLDAGPLESAVHSIKDDKIRNAMLAEMRSRRHRTVRALVELVLARPLSADAGEPSILSEAIDHAVAGHGRFALLGHVEHRIANPTPEMIESASCHDAADFLRLTKGLRNGLKDLIHSPEFGGTFSQPTSEDMPVGVNCSFDISAVDLSEERYRAALQIVTWNYAQSVTSSVMSLKEAGLYPEVHYVMGFDELWQNFQVDPRVAVNMLEGLIRINRTKGIGQALITHGTGDLDLPDPALTAKAKQFVARSSMRVYGGIPYDEIDSLEKVQKFTNKERELLGAWAADSGSGSVPLGRGKFLAKFGDDPGIPINMGPLTALEGFLHNTNENFDGAKNALAGHH